MINNFFFFENHVICEIMGKNFVDPDRPLATIWLMRIAYWIPKATNTHSQYATLIAFPLHQWLQGRSSVLRYTYLAFIVIEFDLHNRNFGEDFRKIVKATLSFVMYVRLSSWKSAQTGRIFVKFDFSIFRKYVQNNKVLL